MDPRLFSAVPMLTAGILAYFKQDWQINTGCMPHSFSQKINPKLSCVPASATLCKMLNSGGLVTL